MTLSVSVLHIPFFHSDSPQKQKTFVSIYLLFLKRFPLMSSDTTPSTSTEPITPDTTNTPITATRTLTGGCLCKSIRYKITRNQCQERMNMSMCSLHNGRNVNDRCHCGTCQQVTSSAFSLGLVVPNEAFQLEDAGNNMRMYENDLPDSTVGYRIFFCSKCGCYLFHEPVKSRCSSGNGRECRREI